MALRVRFVENLDQVVAPVAAHLASGVDASDLFETEHIIVPNAGVRAWLLQKLAHSMGAGTDSVDGAVGNLRIGFIGTLDRFVSPQGENTDPWSVEVLTFAVLQAVADLHDDADVAANIARLGGGLAAARSMADRFDRYHARRPHMIRSWEAGRAELSPCTSGDSLVSDEGGLEAIVTVAPLAQGDIWQFTLWRKVRAIIGTPSPPARVAEALQVLSSGERPDRIPRRIAVVGLQSLSPRHMELLLALSGVCDITVLLVHPSPELAERWGTMFADAPASHGTAVVRPQSVAVPPGMNALVWSWLRGAMDLQRLLSGTSLGRQFESGSAPISHTGLLGHLKRAVQQPSAVTAHEIAADDQSFLVHRAHNLARQVEVLHDALLHAFGQLPDLQPHEVVIMSPDIERAAPLLQATFGRPVTNQDGETFVLPLVVADRGLREYDEGARLMVDLIALLRSRFGVTDVLDVITSPLVLDRFGMGSSDVETWKRYMDLARVRWGIDESHRRSAWGVDLGADGTAHTWLQAVRRSLLGAVLPDAEVPEVELGGAVPVVGVEPGEVRAITALAELLHILAGAQSQVSGERPVADWCALIEDTINQLVNGEDGEMDDALQAVHRFLSSSLIPSADGEVSVDVTVDFAHIGSLVTEELTAAPGRQPLRTGAITATSMIPLRSVPFRVVCLVGLDDGVFGVGDMEGDDLESRQSLIGDSDVRLEQRRSLLDAVVAAGDRVIITCTGRNVKNNVLTPLVTPLAELVELCGELGAGRNRHNKDLSAVEVLHPRHFNSAPNFVKGALVDGLVWSHSSAALRAASAQAPKPESSFAVKGLDLEALQVVPVEMLEKVVHDPLRVYVRDTLHINTWRDDRQDDPATVPLSISKRDTALLAESLLVTLRSGGTVESWERAAVLGGELPPGCFRAAELAGVKAFVDELRTALNEWTSVSVEDVDIRIDLGDGRVVRGTVPNVHTRADGTCFVLTPCFSEREYVTARSTVPLHMILLAAAGRNVTDGPIPSLHADGGKVARRNIRPVTDLQQDACITRLRNLVSLLETARSMPCPSFDGAGILAVTDRDAAADKFQACVEGHGYSWSDEALVHGFSPFFDDVFPEDSPLIGFWAAHDANAPHAADGKNNVPKGWRRFEFA